MQEEGLRCWSGNSGSSSCGGETICPEPPAIVPMDDPIIPDDYSLESEPYFTQARKQPKKRNSSGNKQPKIILSFLSSV